MDTSYKTTLSSCTFLTLTPDSGYLMCGGSASLINPLKADITVIKVNSSGNPQWAKHYILPPGSYSPATNHITATSDSNYVICGGINGHFILKINDTGNQLWMKEYYTQVPTVAQWVEETADKGLIIGGYPIFFGGLLMKTDSMGNFQWINTLSGPNLFGGCLKQTPDGGYVMATRASSANGHAIEIFKTDSMGLTGGCLDFIPTVTVTNVNDTVFSVPVIDSILSVTTTPVTITTTNVGIVYDICPTGLLNLQNDFVITLFPNPVKSILSIKLASNISGNANFLLHDIFGREVLVQKINLVNGVNTFTFDVSKLAAGIYMVEFSNATNKYFAKVVVE